MRKALLAMIDNLAQDEAQATETRRVPSTRELSGRLRRVAGEA
jgi:hypothetical protein